MPFGQIKTADSVDEKSREKALEDIEQWRFLAANFQEWYKFWPTQAFLYDWLDFRKTKRQRVYPW